MDGEKRFIVVMTGVTVICLTVLYAFLFISLWPYRQWVGTSILGVLILLVVVYARGRINKQNLRQVRYRRHEEIPLDIMGEPVYWPSDVQRNPHSQLCPPVDELDIHASKGDRRNPRRKSAKS